MAALGGVAEMSFAKAEQLLDLATMVSAREQCVTRGQVSDKFRDFSSDGVAN